MIGVECLAHRGWWKEPREKNTAVALERAFRAGFGVETDLRDQGDRIVVCHDPPGWGPPPELDFEQLLKLYRDCDAQGTLALNIKADGLADEVQRLLDQYDRPRHFVFDMSIPDMVAYTSKKIRVFERLSELESPMEDREQLLGSAFSGIWLDSFFSIWYSPQLIRDQLKLGRDVCVVSPELHRRDQRPSWSELRELADSSELDQSTGLGRLMLCTDYPDDF